MTDESAAKFKGEAQAAAELLPAGALAGVVLPALPARSHLDHSPAVVLAEERFLLHGKPPVEPPRKHPVNKVCRFAAPRTRTPGGCYNFLPQNRHSAGEKVAARFDATLGC